jgi:hypothetical protein
MGAGNFHYILRVFTPCNTEKRSLRYGLNYCLHVQNKSDQRRLLFVGLQETVTSSPTFCTLRPGTSFAPIQRIFNTDIHVGALGLPTFRHPGKWRRK